MRNGKASFQIINADKYYWQVETSSQNMMSRNYGKGVRQVHQNVRFAPPASLAPRRHPSGFLSEDLVIISMCLTTCIVEERGSLKSTIGISINNVLKKILGHLTTCNFIMK